jgi:hypothetical protein
LPRLSTKLGKRKPERGNVEDMTVEERLAMLNTTNENAKVPHNFFSRGIFSGLRIRIRIGSGFNRVSGSGSGFGIGIRIRIQEGKNDPHK